MTFAKEGKTYVILNYESVFGETLRARVTVDDVARYYRHEACNLSSGCRRLASIVGDWRQVDYIAKDCLDYFKGVNLNGMRRAAKRLGLTPRF